MHPAQAKRGVALVIVLAFLVLLSALVLAFFNSVQTDLSAASNYRSAIEARQLVESATQVVTGQITDATRSFKVRQQPSTNPTIPAGGRVTWASQPGLIRTWGDDGLPWKNFKLYSAKDMVADQGSSPYKASDVLAQEIPNDWPKKPAEFVDLNSPVIVADANGKISRDSAKYRASYPIVDPAALTRKVDGFSLTATGSYGGPPIASWTDSYDPASATRGDKTGNPAAMPVAWMYVLKDGTLTTPSGSSSDGRTASWDSVSDTALKPSKTNPIVGRFAFWTDDESCKLNVNTASEPTAWDSPKAVTIQDLNYGKFQPARNEFQRYPGHPFMTALSPALFPGVTLTSVQKETIYSLIPRVQPGGTVGGTIPAKTLNGGVPLVLDSDRLFANVDEFLFQPNRTLNSMVSTDQLKAARFFLTANSKAPELNLFGQPRIGLWPVHSNAGLRTAYDKLAAFCTTVGTGASTKGFYFQRADALSPTADYTGIKRNQDLYAYLQRLTNDPVPGYGASFNAGWTTDRDQILTEIFDYIRCVNLRDPQQAAAGQFSTNGQVSPIRINSTQGFGRFQTLTQAGIHIICCQDGPKGAIDPNNPKLPTGIKAVQAAIYLQPFTVSQGFYEIFENLTYEVSLGAMSLAGTDLGFPSSTVTIKSNNLFARPWHGRNWGGSVGIRGFINAGGGSLASKRIKLPANASTMAFSGGNVTVRIYSGTSAAATNLLQTLTFTMPSGTFPVPILVGKDTTAFRGTPVTTADKWWTMASRFGMVGSCNYTPGSDEYPTAARQWNVTGTGFRAGSVIRAEDVVRTVVPFHGDFRLIAARNSVPASTFVPGYFYTDTSRRIDHLFSEFQGPHMMYGFSNEPGLTGAEPGLGGRALPKPSQLTTASYHYSRLPEIMPGAGAIYNLWNDFDNGTGQMTDGAYINKPDEGNIADQNSQYPYFAWDFTAPSQFLFSPNRLVPSAGMLGSLPTGVIRSKPWQTLLFRPQPGHPGAGSPASGPPFTRVPDHLVMDLFWMPVIEPYAISEPFSTSGKINMNYEIFPFNYIRRATALHGALKSEEPLIIPNTASKIYKLWDHETNDWPSYPNSGADRDAAVRADWDKLFKGQAPFDKLRRPLDIEKTLAQFETRFSNGNPFRSASEICTVHLVRQGETLNDYTSGTIWKNSSVTGDNTREKPYTNLYAKLTTKSNVFTVHIRAQSLQKATSVNDADWASWREGTDKTLSEYRGSTVIERFIDPADPNLLDFATFAAATADTAYRFRTITTKQFTP